MVDCRHLSTFSKGVDGTPPGRSDVYPQPSKPSVLRLATPYKRRLLHIGAPLGLAVVEVFHPAASTSTMFGDVAAHLDRWLAVHLLQLPMFALVAFTVIQLTDGLGGGMVARSRLALAAFVVASVGLDSAVGLTSAILVRNAIDLPSSAQDVVAHQVQLLSVDPWVGSKMSLLGVVSSVGWLVGVGLAAVALYEADRPLIPVVLLALSGPIFAYGGHTMPAGPVTFAAVFMSVILLECSAKRTAAERVPNNTCRD